MIFIHNGNVIEILFIHFHLGILIKKFIFIFIHIEVFLSIICKKNLCEK
jgi:hypothetical protein